VTSHSGTITETQCRASTADRATTELCSRLNPTRLAVSVALPPTRSRHSPDWDDAPSMTEVHARTKIHQSELITVVQRGRLLMGDVPHHGQMRVDQCHFVTFFPTERDHQEKRSVRDEEDDGRRDTRERKRHTAPEEEPSGSTIQDSNPAAHRSKRQGTQPKHTGQTPPRPNSMTAPTQPQEDRVELPGALGSQQRERNVVGDGCVDASH
jgi:hypothetical protein